MQIVEYIKDRYLTWRTGKDKQRRDYQKWADETIAWRPDTIEGMFANFRYILPVSTNIFHLDDPFGWSPCEDFRQYLYPARALGDNTVFYVARGYRNEWDGRFYINDIRHEQDQVFVATNNETDAIMIALKYS